MASATLWLQMCAVGAITADFYSRPAVQAASRTPAPFRPLGQSGLYRRRATGWPGGLPRSSPLDGMLCPFYSSHSSFFTVAAHPHSDARLAVPSSERQLRGLSWPQRVQGTFGDHAAHSYPSSDLNGPASITMS